MAMVNWQGRAQLRPCSCKCLGPLIAGNVRYKAASASAAIQIHRRRVVVTAQPTSCTGGQPPSSPPPGKGRWCSDGDSHDGHQPGSKLQACWVMICHRLLLLLRALGLSPPLWATLANKQRWIVLSSLVAWSFSVQPAAAAGRSTQQHTSSNEVHFLAAAHPAAQEEAGLSLEDDLLETGQPDAPVAPPPRGGAIQALKRLLREVFADLLTLKQQVEDLTPKSEEDDVVIPHEGGSVTPVTRLVAPGVRYKSKSQLSGSITWGTPLLSTNTPAGADSSAACAVVAHAHGMPMEVLLQTMTSDRHHSLTARLTTLGTASAAAEPGMGPALPHLPGWTPHPGHHTTHTLPATLGGGGGGGGGGIAAHPAPLTLQGLLYRAELLSGKLRVCCAPVGGSLSSIARRLNPKAGPTGLTAVAQQGHGIPAVLEPGSGAAVTWVPGASGDARDGSREGVFSASVGHFMSAAGAAGQVLHHTLAQVGWHSHEAGSASVVLSSAGITSSQQSSHSPLLPGMSSLTSMAPGTPTRESSMGGGHLGAASMWGEAAAQMTTQGAHASPQHRAAPCLPTASIPDGRAVRVGMAVFKTFADVFSVTGWHSRTLKSRQVLQEGPAASAAGHGGVQVDRGGCGSTTLGDVLRGGSSGCQISSVPDRNGVSISLTLALANDQQGESVVRRESSESRVGVGATRTLLAELSAHVPVADGLWLTPGFVMLSRADREPASLCVACSAGWHF